MAFGPVNVPGKSGEDTSGLVPETRTINGKPLSEDIELTAEDVGAAGEEHEHDTTYLTKNDPVYTGTLSNKGSSSIRLTGNGSISIGGYVQEYTQNFVVGSSYGSANNDSMLIGMSCFAGLYGEITSATKGETQGYAATWTLSVSADADFWTNFDSLEWAGYSLPIKVALFLEDSIKNESYCANIRISAVDKSAGTVTLSNVANGWDLTSAKKILPMWVGMSYTPATCKVFTFGNRNGILLSDERNNHTPIFVVGDDNYTVGGSIYAIGRQLRMTDGDTTYESRKSPIIILGEYNKDTHGDFDRVIVGGGSKSARANCCRITTTGVFASGNYNSTGADYAELFEWADSNPEGEDRIGRFVTLDGTKIRLAGPEDTFILGVVSGSPSVIGDVYDDQWQGMYLYDIFGRPIWEDVEIPEETREEPDPKDPEKMITQMIPAHMEHRQKLNPDYDPAQKYIPRTKRPEWGCVGLMGKLIALEDGSCQVDGWVTAGKGGKAVFSEEPTRWRCMEKLTDPETGRKCVRVMIL